MSGQSTSSARDRAALDPAQQARLFAALRDFARRLTRRMLTAWLLYVAAGAALFPLLTVIGDHLLPGGLPRRVLFGAGLVWLGATVLLAGAVSGCTLLRRLNAVFVARQVERGRGIPHNPLVNAVLLHRTDQADYAREAAVRQASTALAGGRPDARYSPVPLRMPLLLVLTAVACWAVYAALAPKPILPSLARLLGADRDPPSATRIELVRPRPDQPVYAGEPLAIELSVSGPGTAEVWFELLASGAADAPPLLRQRLRRSEQAEGAERFQTTLAGHEVARDLHYRCLAGDARLAGVIPVLPQPDLRALEIELAPPEYLGQPPSRTAEPNLRVWAGTRATFVARATTELRDPVFVFRSRGETRTRMTVDQFQPQQASSSLRLTESGEYWIEFSDRFGRSNIEPPHYRVSVRHDAPPHVQIATPAEDEAAGGLVDVAHFAALRVVAGDDVGLAALDLVRDVNGEPRRTSLLDAQVPARGRSVEVAVPTGDLPLEVGQPLRVWFEARDTRVLLDGTPAPQVARSRELLLVRTPDATPAQLAQEDAPASSPADTTTLARTTRTSREVRSDQAGDPNRPGDAAAAAGRSQGGPDQPGGLYRRAADGADGQSGPEQQQPSDVLGPEDLVLGGGEQQSTPQDVEQPQDAPQRTQAARAFEDELRRFGREHGNEAAELNRRIGGRGEQVQPEDGEAEGAGGAGGGSGSDEQQRPMPDGVPADSPAPPTAEHAAGGPSEPNQAQAPEAQSQPTASRTADARPAGGESAGESGRPEQPAPQTTAREGEPPSEPREGEAPADWQEGKPSAEGRDGAPSAERREGEPPVKPSSATPAGPQSRSAPDSDAPASQPAAQLPSEQREEGTGAQLDEQGQPRADHGDGERVIPMPGNSRDAAPVPGQGEAPGTPDSTGLSRPASRSELTDTLELLRRIEELDERDLLDLGWSAAQRNAFVRDFQRLQAAARAAGVLAQLRNVKTWRTRLELGAAEVAQGAGLAAGVATEAGGGPSVQDGLEQIVPPAEQRIAPELQVLLDAYYRSLAQRRDAGGAADGLAAPASP